MTPLSTSFRSSLAVLLLAVAATACGSSEDGGSIAASTTPTTDVANSSEPVIDTAADDTAADDTAADDTVETEPSTTDSESTDSTDSEPEIIGSVTIATVTIPADDSDDSFVEPAAEQLRDGVPMNKGTLYAIIDPTSGTGISIVSSVDVAYPFLLSNSASFSLDPTGIEGLVGVSSLDHLRTFIDPTVDIMQIPPEDLQSVTEPAAADFLAWISGLPGVTVGPVEETTVDGWPSRSMTYAFGPSHNGLPCDDTSLAGCVVTLWNPAGSVSFYAPNDTGTLYDVVVDGSRALIDVTSRPGAQEMFESLHFLFEDEG